MVGFYRYRDLAERNDAVTLNKHLEFLDPDLRDLYERLSKGIIDFHKGR